MCNVNFLLVTIRRPPTTTLFPYTTLFLSVGQDGILSHEFSALQAAAFVDAPTKTWDKMASCPTNFQRYRRRLSSKLPRKRGTRWHLVPRIFSVTGGGFRQSSHDNVGQDGILVFTHIFASCANHLRCGATV